MHISLPQDVLDYINYLCICNREHKQRMQTSFLQIFENVFFFSLTMCVCHTKIFKRGGQILILGPARPLFFILLQANCKCDIFSHRALRHHIVNPCDLPGQSGNVECRSEVINPISIS